MTAFDWSDMLTGDREAPSANGVRPADEEALRATLAAANHERDTARILADERRRRQVRRDLDAEEAAEQSGRRKLRLTPGSAFKIKPVRWVWGGRMPAGEITLVPGREGAGKSTFLAWMAAAITNGTLPGMHHGAPRSVLYAATEDSWEYTIAPRMIAAGADMSRVFRIDVEHIMLTTESGTGKQVQTVQHGKLSLPVDTRLIPEAAAEVGAAALMCDPVISIIDDKINTFKAQELRGALEPLKRAVEEAGIALVGLVHFNKSKDTDVLSMISGSRAWPEVARAVIAVAVDKDADEYTCVVSQVKNNLGRADLPHLKYTIDSTVLRAADHPDVAEEDVSIGVLRWTGESERGAEEILQAKPDHPQTSRTTQDVVAFVTRRAAALGGPVPFARIVEQFADGDGAQLTTEALKKLLYRAVDRGELVKPSRGMYAPGAPARVRPCPGCGRPLEGDANFCRRCRASLDTDDRASPDDGTLFRA